MKRACIFKDIEEMEYIIENMFDNDPCKAMKHYRQGLAGAIFRKNKKTEEIFKHDIDTIKLIISKREN